LWEKLKDSYYLRIAEKGIGAKSSETGGASIQIQEKEQEGERGREVFGRRETGQGTEKGKERTRVGVNSGINANLRNQKRREKPPTKGKKGWHAGGESQGRGVLKRTRVLRGQDKIGSLKKLSLLDRVTQAREKEKYIGEKIDRSRNKFPTDKGIGDRDRKPWREKGGENKLVCVAPEGCV